MFSELVPAHSLQLTQDVFGNYVIQKLLEHTTPAQKAMIGNTLEGHVLPLSLQMYGCRVVQKVSRSRCIFSPQDARLTPVLAGA